MYKHAYRLTAIVIAVAMALTALAGCNNNSGSDSAADGSPRATPVSNGNNSNSSGDEQPEYVYVAETVPLPTDMGILLNFICRDDKIYFSSISNRESADDPASSYGDAAIYSINADGTGLARLPSYTPPVSRPEGADGQVAVTKMAFDDDEYLWVVEVWAFFTYELPEEERGTVPERGLSLDEYLVMLEEGAVIRKLDAQGVELLRADISYLMGQHEYFYISALAIHTETDGSETICVAMSMFEKGSVVYLLDTAGNAKSRFDTESEIGYLFTLPDGGIAFTTGTFYNADGTAKERELQTIDFSRGVMGETIKIPNPGRQINIDHLQYYPADGDFDMLVDDGTDLYAFSLGDDEAVRLLNWMDCNVIVGSIQNIMMSGEQIVCTNSFWGDKPKYELFILTKTLHSELPEKTVITLATFGYLAPIVENAAVEFNKKNTEYTIEIKDYSGDGSDGLWDSGVTRLATEIAAGIIPDIIDMSTYPPYREYAEMGLLADIYTFIDADPEFERGDFVQEAFRAYEIDGSLYQVFDSFTIVTLAVPKSVAGPGIGWTIDECAAVLDAYPDADMPFGGLVPKTAMLSWSVRYAMDDYVDWEAGIAHFDSPEFIKLLELCDRFPRDKEYSGGYEIFTEEVFEPWRQIGDMAFISDFYALPELREKFGEEVVPKGFPAADRNGYSIRGNNCLAITEPSPHKEAAWSFVRQLLTEEWQNYDDYWYPPLSTNRASFDASLSKALETGRVETFEIDGELRDVVWKTTREEADMVLALIENAAANPYGRDLSPLFAIITEGVSDYFNGVKTAEEAAKIIQSRASIYVAEHS